MSTDWRALCEELADGLASTGEAASGTYKALLDRARAALAAEPVADEAMPPRVGHILRLAEIIREVDGNHDKGAAALAEAILSHPRARAALAAEADGPAVPEGREPASVVGEPSDVGLLELMPQQFREDLATVSRMAAHGAGTGVTPGLFRVILNTGALDYARAVLARYGHQPAPSAVGEGVTDDEIERRFQVWWYDEGSGMPPGADEDSEAHVHRVSQIAWRNGAYVARYSHQPAPPAEGKVGVLLRELRDAAFDLNGSDPAKSMLTRAADLLEQCQAAPVPVAWCNSGDFLAASAKRQSFNGWLEQHSDCDMALCIAQLPAHALQLPLPTREGA